MAARTVVQNKGRWVVLGLIAGLFAATPAQASINVQNFYPAASPRYVHTEGALGDFGIRGDGSEDPDVQALYLSVFWNYVHDPLVVLDSTRTQRLGVLINRINTLNLGVGYGINSATSIHIDAPMHWVGRDGQSDALGFGDVRLFARFRITDARSNFGFSLVPEIRFPSGSQTLSVSDGSASGGLMLAGEMDLGGVTLAGNLGYRYTPGADYLDLSAIHRIPIRVGAMIPVGEGFSLNAEYSTDILVPLNSYVNPSELYGGINWQATRELRVYAGVGIGSVNNISSADFRMIAGIKILPLYSEKAEAPVEAPKPVAKVAAAPILAPVKPRVVFQKNAITLTEEVKFEHAKDVLTESGRNLLDEVGEVIKKNNARYSKIIIEGHCNELGTDQYNIELSKGRALAVREYLGSRGVDKERLESIGYGKRFLKSIKYPKLSHESQLAMDRRVEFKVIPPAGVTPKGPKQAPKPKAGGVPVQETE